MKICVFQNDGIFIATVSHLTGGEEFWLFVKKYSNND